jgi:hypothetical protein
MIENLIVMVRTICITVTFVCWGFLIGFMVGQMGGNQFDPTSLFSGMAIGYMLSLKYT